MAFFKKIRARKRVSKALKKYVLSQTKKNPRVKIPTTFIPAHVRVDQHGNVQIKVNPRNLKGTGKFARCVKAVEARGGAYDARAVCGAMEKRGRRNPSDVAYDVQYYSGGWRHAGTVYASTVRDAMKRFRSSGDSELYRGYRLRVRKSR